MRFFVLLACLVASVLSFAYGGYGRRSTVYNPNAGKVRNQFGQLVPAFTCTRQTWPRCFNIHGQEVDQNGRDLTGNRWGF